MMERVQPSRLYSGRITGVRIFGINFTDELTLITLAGIIGVLTSTALFYAVLTLIAAKQLLSRKSATGLRLFLPYLPFLLINGIISFGLLSQRGPVESMMHWMILPACLLVGMTLGGGEDLRKLRESLLSVRNLVFVCCIISALLELTLGMYLVGQGEHSFFEIRAIQEGTQDERVKSVFGHPIIFSQFLLSAIILTLILEDKKWIKEVSTLIFLLFLYLTGSRSAWISGFILLLFYAFAHFRDVVWSTRWNYIAIVLPLVILLCATVASDMLISIGNRFLLLFEGDGSYSFRSQAAILAINKLLANPLHLLVGFGEGAGAAFIHEQLIVGVHFSTIDVGWITVLFDYGLLGLSMFVILVAKAFYAYWQQRNQVTLALLGGGTGVGILMFFYYDMHNSFTPYVFFLICTACLGAMAKTQKKQDSSKASIKTFRV